MLIEMCCIGVGLLTSGDSKTGIASGWSAIVGDTEDGLDAGLLLLL